MRNQNFEFIRNTTWDEVFSDWKKREAGIWEDHFRAKGFETWDEWRGQLNLPWGLGTRDWKLFRVIDTLKTVPTFWAGAYPGWQKYFPKRVGKARFSDLLNSSILKNNKKISNVLNSFPARTQVIGFGLDDDVVILEGMHRCTALAIAAANESDIKTDFIIAITDFDESERDLFERARTQQDARQ